MPQINANGITLEYEDRGTRDAPVVLLIMGLGAQLIYWPDSLCHGLVEDGFRVIFPPLALCTDNAAMIAWAGLERYAAGMIDALDFKPRPRWPLQEMTAA